METVKTRIYKGREGWTGESTITNVNGYDWEIMTYKSSGGIISTAQSGQKTENGFSYMMFTNPSVRLVHERVRATEKSVTEIHKKGVMWFAQLHKSGELPKKK